MIAREDAARMVQPNSGGTSQLCLRVLPSQGRTEPGLLHELAAASLRVYLFSLLEANVL